MVSNSCLKCSAKSTLYIGKTNSAKIALSGSKPSENDSPKRRWRAVDQTLSQTPHRLQPAVWSQWCFIFTKYQLHSLCLSQQLVEESCNLWGRDFRPWFSAFLLEINTAFLTFQVHRQNILSSIRLLTCCAEEIYYSLRNWWVSYSFWTRLTGAKYIYPVFPHNLGEEVNLFTISFKMEKTKRWMWIGNS